MGMGSSRAARLQMHATRNVDRELARRVGRYVAAVGERDALRTLGVGKSTLDAARAGGRLLGVTVERLEAAVERAELDHAEGVRNGASLAEVGT